MDSNSRKLQLEDIWQSVDNAILKPMTVQEGYRWGLDYLQGIKKELLVLEASAKDRNDPGFFNDVQRSMLRALEAEDELEEKIKNSQ